MCIRDRPIAHDDTDRAQWLALLGDSAQACGVDLHAYVLMPDHFHLLATPGSDDGLPRLMQALGRRYVRHFNTRHGHRGTLWEGRYRATIVDPRTYLLPCMVHIDTNPVRAGLVARADDYAWSSCRHYVGREPSRLLKPHPEVWSLGNTPFAREAAYAEMVREGLDERLQAAVAAAALHGWALGNEAFVASLQKLTDRRLVKNKPGRPVSVSR